MKTHDSDDSNQDFFFFYVRLLSKKISAKGRTNKKEASHAHIREEVR